LGAYFCAMPMSFQLKFSPQDVVEADWVNAQFAKSAGLDAHTCKVVWRKKSLDARGRAPFFLITADVYAQGELVEAENGYRLKSVEKASPVHIIGAGPAGLFCALELIELGLKPIVLERGKAVKERRRDLAILNRDGPVQKVLQCLVDHGAPDSILYDAHPHIGTNKLPQLVEGIRQTIEAHGGEIRFDTRVDGLLMESDRIVRLRLNGGATEKVDKVVLATGHSARDIFEMLVDANIAIEAKPFAIGVRLEHPQSIIDQIQYKFDNRGEFLPPSSYSLVEQIQGRGVFSFCMCPGGIIAPAATAAGEVVVNGWSPSKRNGNFANSGFVVSVDDRDFNDFNAHGELRALRYQQHWEQTAFRASGSLSAPAQRMEDFIQGKLSNDLPSNSYLPGLVSAQIGDVLSSAVHSRIKESLVVLGKKMKAFRTNDAILVGIESRTSSPVRIPRDSSTLTHPQILNLFPCGEGAGYAGGIMSAALDGIRVAQAQI